jgi:hypothetical protein
MIMFRMGEDSDSLEPSGTHNFGNPRCRICTRCAQSYANWPTINCIEDRTRHFESVN